MKKNVITYIIAGIFIFFITYFTADIIIDVIKEHRGDDSSTPEESYNPDNSVDVADVVYTIVYNTNAENVTGTMENQEVKVDEEATLLSNQFSRVGYTFTGWSTTTTGRVEYTNEQVVKNLTENSIKVNLYAVWQANTYTITFNSNTATGNMENITMTYDVETSLPTNTFIKEGYTFINWNTQEDGSGTSYSYGQSIKNLLTEGQITLYAMWQANEYKVEFNANNGIDSKVEQALIYDQEAKLLANTFTRTGYSFVGWSTTTSGRVIYTNEQVVKGLSTVNNDTISLYAVWVANTYTVKFDGNGAIGTMSDLTMTYDVSNMLSSNGYKKDGYTFTGWNTALDGTGLSYDNNQTVNNLLESGSMTLYAQWSEHTYKVIFNANNGTELSNEQIFGYEDNKTLSPNAYSKEGYTFAGWSSIVDGGKEYDDEEKVTHLTTINNGEVNLYAVWVANTYTINFDGNGATGEMDPQGRTYDDGMKVSSNTFTRDGYTFIGWLNEENEPVSDLYEGNLTSENKTITLYANWVEHTYKVIFNANNGTQEYKEQSYNYSETKALLENTYSKEGYTFIGWSTTSSGRKEYDDNQEVSSLTTINNGEVNLYAVWVANTYTINFDGNGATGEMDPQGRTYDDGMKVSSNTFTRDGYTFIGWLNEENEPVSDLYEGNLTSENKTITLYANWVEHTYTVVFHSNDGNDLTKQQTFTYSETKQLLDCEYSMYGYTLDGWSTTVSGRKEYEVNQEVSSLTAINEGVIDLYAVWRVNSYTLVFDANDSSATGSMNSQTRHFNDGKTVSANTFVKDGYKFVGWKTSDGTDITNEQFGNITVEDGITITLYAQWALQTYKIHFFENNEEMNYVAQDFNYAEEKALLANPFTKQGYTFVGWSTSRNGRAEYENQEVVSRLTEEDGAIIDLYAVWQVNTYTVKFDANGENVTGLMKDMVLTYEDYEQLPYNTFTREGYSFIKWTTNPDGTGKQYIDADTMYQGIEEGTLTLYAQWKEHTYHIYFYENCNDYSYNYIQVTYSQSITLPKNEYSLLGHTFVGWATSATGNVVYFDEQVVQGITTVDRDVVHLYAIWQANTYTVKFDGNGATSGNMEDEIRVYGDAKQLPTLAYEKEGYSFVYWLTPNGDILADIYMGDIPDDEYKEITLKAIWEINTYKVTYVFNNSDVEYKQYVYNTTIEIFDKALEVQNRADFDKWIVGSTQQEFEFGIKMPANDLIIYAIYKEQATVKFDFNDNVNLDIIQGYVGDNIVCHITEPYREGYEFTGWYTDNTLTTLFDFENTKMSEESITIYAGWKANEYTIVYDGNGATSGHMDVQTRHYDDNVGALDNQYEKTGYTFFGWELVDHDYVAVGSFRNFTSEKGAVITLYAVWVENTYDVVFHANNNTSITYSQNFLYTQEQELTNNMYTYVGHTFVGWSTSIDGEVVYNNADLVSKLTDVNNGKYNLYAKWEVNTYTIEFDGNGADGSMDVQARTYGDNASIKANTFIRDGYTFVGWTDDNGRQYDDQYIGDLTTLDDVTITLYAKWVEHTYKVIFHANNKTNASNEQTFTYSEEKALYYYNYFYTGHTFIGWSDTIDGEVKYSDEQVVKGLTNVDKQEIHLYAVYRVHTYTISFYSDGNEGSMESINRVYGDNLSLPKNQFSKLGYTFGGWSSSEQTTFEDEYKGDITISDNVTITLYAIWIPNSYTVIFHANNGTNASNEQSFTYPVVQELDANIYSRNGYSFAGWSTTSNGTVQYYDKQIVSELLSNENGEFNLYAVWTANTYVIEFKANGGNGTMDNQERSYDDNLSLPSVTFTRDGYTFVGWNTLNGEFVDKNSTNNLTNENNSTVTLLAQWTMNSYKVIFIANNKTNASNEQSFTYEEEKALTSNMYSKLGYTFSGWSTSINGSVEYNDAQIVKQLTSKNNEEVKLYAIWNPITYTINFDANGGNGEMDSQVRTYDDNQSLPVNTFTRDGYTFVGWVTLDNEFVDKNSTNNLSTTNNTTLTLFAKWQEHTYSVVFIANNNTSATKVQNFTYSTSQTLLTNTFTYVGHTFAGWKNEDGTVKYNDNQEVSKLTATDKGEVKLYAMWIEHEYTIVFNKNDESATGNMVNQTFTYTEEKAILANEFVKLGYTFMGWSTDANSKVVTYTDQVTVSKLSVENNTIINVYAVWHENTYTLELHANDNTSASNIHSLKYSESYTINDSFTRKGYTFVGWSTSPTGEKVYESNATVSKLMDTTGTYNLYAKWIEHEYTIVFNSNYGTGIEDSTTSQEFTYSEEKALLANEFSKYGYRFVGWSTDASSNVVSYADQVIVSKLTDENNAVINLYAIWEEITYTLELHANNASTSSTIKTLKYSDITTLTNEFKRVGYVFVGWSTSEDGEVIYEEDEEVSMLTDVNNETIHLYAIWQEIDRRDVILTINDDTKEYTLERINGLYNATDIVLSQGNVTFTIINYITDRMYEFDTYVDKKGYYDVTFNLTSLTYECVYTFEYIERGEYDEAIDSVEGIDATDLSAIKNAFDSITSTYTIETQTYFNPAAIRIINRIYETDYKQHNVATITSDKDNDSTFTLFDVNSSYIDNYGPTTVKYSSSYSVDYLGWTRVAENKYKCDRVEVVEHFRQLLTPGLSNDGTYMTYKYITVTINQDGSLTIRLYCSTTQSGKVILEHKDEENKPQWYMLLSEATITNIE